MQDCSELITGLLSTRELTLLLVLGQEILKEIVYLNFFMIQTYLKDSSIFEFVFEIFNHKVLKIRLPGVHDTA